VLLNALEETPLTTELVVLNLAIALAGIVQASAGLGFAMVANPLLALINIAYLPGPMLFANLFLSSAILWREGPSLDRREMPPLMTGLLVGTFLPIVALTRRNILFGGIAGGVTGIVAAMHAPPLVMLYHREEAVKIRATFATVFVVGCTMALIGLWLSGRFGIAEVWMGVALLPGIVLGFTLGRFIAARVSREAARLAMLTISGVGGVVLVLKSL